MGAKVKKRGIAITIPRTISWESYQNELDAVSDWSKVMNYKVAKFPKELNIGDRVYLCYDGNIIGWQTFVGFSNGEFTCDTTGKDWKGGFIQRSGPFHYLKEPIPCKGFRGFKYINYTLNESHTAKKLLEEARSVNDDVQLETKHIVDEITKKLNGNKKQTINLNINIFGSEVSVECVVYNAKNSNDYASLSNDHKFENSFTPQTNTLKLFLFFLNGELTKYGYDSIAHELSHIYQTRLGITSITDVNVLLHKYIDSQDRFERHLAYLLYFSDQNEQDAVIQGLEASLKPSSIMADVSERYTSSYAKEMLDTFGFLLKEFSNNKDSFYDAIRPYREYNLDYGRILRRARNAYKRFKLKIAHILSTHIDKRQGRPDLEKIKNDFK